MRIHTVVTNGSSKSLIQLSFQSTEMEPLKSFRIFTTSVALVAVLYMLVCAGFIYKNRSESYHKKRRLPLVWSEICSIIVLVVLATGMRFFFALSTISTIKNTTQSTTGQVMSCLRPNKFWLSLLPVYNAFLRFEYPDVNELLCSFLLTGFGSWYLIKITTTVYGRLSWLKFPRSISQIGGFGFDQLLATRG